jgi:hypothetical protein
MITKDESQTRKHVREKNAAVKVHEGKRLLLAVKLNVTCGNTISVFAKRQI